MPICSARLAALPAIAVPIITLDGAGDGVAPATDGNASAAKFTGRAHPSRGAARRVIICRRRAGGICGRGDGIDQGVADVRSDRPQRRLVYRRGSPGVAARDALPGPARFMRRRRYPRARHAPCRRRGWSRCAMSMPGFSTSPVMKQGPASGPAVILLHGFPTTFIPMSMSSRSWPRRVSASSFLICAALARRDSANPAARRSGEQAALAPT